MRNYLIHEISTGRVVETGSEHSSSALSAKVVASGLAMIKSELPIPYNKKTYYPLGVKTDRPSQTIAQDTDTILADGIEKSTFTGVADGSELFIDDVSSGTVGADGIATASFDTVGTFKIRFVLFPYLDAELVVNAT